MVGKKSSWEGAPKKCKSMHPSQKVAEESKKINWSISNAPEIKYVSHLCFNSKHTDATLRVPKRAQLKDITLTTQCFIFVLFLFCRYYNKFFRIILQIKSLLVLIINYLKI